MVTIAVTGPNGRLGSELVNRGCIPIEADVTDFYALNQAILKIQPDCIIHCAAKTNVDACETQAMEAMKVNVGGTYGLSQVYNGKIVYISTDYVFDGTSGPYAEDAKPCPISIYGWSKLGGEIVLVNKGNPHLIIRTTCLYDRHSKNFVTSIAAKLRVGEPVKVPASLYGNPTYVPHLAEGILAAVEKGARGILHIVGNEILSRFELAWKIGEVLNVNNNDLVFAGLPYGKAPRPLKAGLTTNLAKSLNIPLYSTLEGLMDALETEKTPAYN